MKTYIDENGCGGPAFKYDGEIELDVRIVAEHAFHLNGTQMVPMEQVLCDSCGSTLGPRFMVEWFVDT